MNAAVPAVANKALELDEWCLRHVDPELLALEGNLFNTAWYDYRNLHPVVRTSLFFKAYYRLMVEYMARQIDHKRAVHAGRTLSTLRFTAADKAAIAKFWRARQQADRLGAPYETFIRSIISTFRDWGWKRIPLPNQMYSATSLDVAANAWDTQMESQMVWPASMACHADSDAWFKEEFDDWFVAQALKRPAWLYILKDAVRKGLMSQGELSRALHKARGEMVNVD